MIILLLLGFGATVNVAKPTKGSTVAVFGLGAVGLAVSFTFSSSLSYLARQLQLADTNLYW